MSIYMVERNLPGISMEQLGAAQQAAIETARELTAGGRPVSYIRSTFVPEEGRCMCLFDAKNAKDVEDLNLRAEIPFERVVPAQDLTP